MPPYVIDVVSNSDQMHPPQQESDNVGALPTIQSGEDSVAIIHSSSDDTSTCIALEISSTSPDNDKAPQISPEKVRLGASHKRRPRLVLEWHDVSFEVPEPSQSSSSCLKSAAPTADMAPANKRILCGLSGRVLPGQLLALMGPSGAGKTTLLNCLSGHKRDYTGEVTLNGQPWCNSLERCAAYVQQDDLFPAHLTPLEHLRITARLRMDHGLSDAAREHAVQDAVVLLGLSKCKDTPIGDPGISRGISGGERKRLSIACEILNDPSVIFCDEPTSGLDSFMAEAVIQQLRDLASDPVRPRTIIATIHQPSSQTFALFDQLNLIADGRNAYFGPADGAVAHFESFGPNCKCPMFVNPSDYFLSLMQDKRVIETICDAYALKSCAQALPLVVRNTELSEEPEVTFKSRYPARWYTQIAVLIHRALLLKWRNGRESSMLIGQTLFFAVVIGCLFFQIGNEQRNVQDVNGLMFLNMMQTAMQQMSPTIQVFAADMPMFMREHKNGQYSMSSLFVARNLVDLIPQTVCPVLYGTIVYVMAGLPAVPTTFFTFLLILLLHGMAGASMGYLMGCAASSRETAQMGTPLAIMPQMFFAGFMINLESIPVYLSWGKYVSFFKYSYEALMINIWQDWGPIGCEAQHCAFQNGEDVIEYLSLDRANFHVSLMLLAAITVGFRLLAWIVLLRRSTTFVTADA